MRKRAPVNRMRPIHPGETLREDYLKPLGLTAHALALRVPASRVNDIALERRAVTADTALSPARHFGGDAQTWINLQAEYDVNTAKRDSGSAINREVASRAA